MPTGFSCACAPACTCTHRDFFFSLKPMEYMGNRPHIISMLYGTAYVNAKNRNEHIVQTRSELGTSQPMNQRSILSAQLQHQGGAIPEPLGGVAQYATARIPTSALSVLTRKKGSRATSHTVGDVQPAVGQTTPTARSDNETHSDVRMVVQVERLEQRRSSLEPRFPQVHFLSNSVSWLTTLRRIKPTAQTRRSR